MSSSTKDEKRQKKGAQVLPRHPRSYRYLLFFAFDFFFEPDFALAFAFPPPPPPILNILVPQTEHVPVNALRPFFITTALSPFISLFALHFTQYPVVANRRSSCTLGYKNSSREHSLRVFQCELRPK